MLKSTEPKPSLTESISSTTTAPLEESEDLETMKNLSLGPCCSACESACKCGAGRGGGSKNRSREPPYPYFWRRTQGNPIQKSKRKTGILTPSSLKYISASGVTTAEGSDGNQTEQNEESKARLVNVGWPDRGRRRGTQIINSKEYRKLHSMMKDIRSALPAIPENSDDTYAWLSYRKKEEPTKAVEPCSTNSTSSDQQKSWTWNQSPDGSSPPSSCSQQALIETMADDITINELASYLDEFVYIPKNMSPMAERMYT